MTAMPTLLAIALAAAAPTPAAAQAINYDVRCLLLSSGYARQAKDENARRAASLTAAFFLGRLSGRLADDALAAVVRAQGAGLSTTEAEPVMRECSARAASADRQMSASVAKAQAAR